jgi:sterol desaturase/sphingolipid hydroxylase (fatty acid hydroxylase superfamily)
MEKKFVSNNPESSRMFKNNILEALSKVHYSIPLFLYIPVIVYFIYKAFFISGMSIVTGLSLIVGGLFAWSFLEYVLHRFVFHYQLKGKIGARIHFIFHGVHHDYPNDAMRLVLPPSVSVPLAFLFYFLYLYLLGPIYMAPVYAGFVSGYLFYDISHYAIHHSTFKSKFWQTLKKHHMQHHYKDDHAGYGVSSKFWDIIFNTDFKRKYGS